MNWRTDLECMPRDGSEFFAMVNGADGAVRPEVLFRGFCRLSAPSDEDAPPTFRAQQAVLPNDPELVTLAAISDSWIDDEVWYATYWYTRAASIADGEHGSEGDSAIAPDRILMWALPPKITVDGDRIKVEEA